MIFIFGHPTNIEDSIDYTLFYDKFYRSTNSRKAVVRDRNNDNMYEKVECLTLVRSGCVSCRSILDLSQSLL
jgi:hypothetical protein